MDGRIVRCGIISSCQSAATSEIVKRFWSRVWLVYGEVPGSLLYSTSCPVLLRSCRRRKRRLGISCRWSTIWPVTSRRGCSTRTSRPTCCWTTGARTRQTAFSRSAETSTSSCPTFPHSATVRQTVNLSTKTHSYSAVCSERIRGTA